MSLAITTSTAAVERAAKRLNALGDYDKTALLYSIGAEVESQTHRRVRDEKTSPDGIAWQAWSKRYDATRHAGHSLLMGEGDLDDSIQSILQGDQVETGSNLPYAAIQNFGGEAVGKPGHPARQYIGFSPENLEDLSFVVDDFIDGHLNEVLQ